MDSEILPVVVGVVATFVGTGIGHLLTTRRDRRPSLAFIVDSDEIYGPELAPHGTFRMEVNGESAERVTRSRVAIWHQHGRREIHGSSIASGDPLRIVCGDAEIVHHFRATDSGPKNGINLAKTNSQTIEISFDYLDQGDGCIVETYTSGEEDVQVKGSIAGVDFIESRDFGLGPDRFDEYYEPDSVLRSTGFRYRWRVHPIFRIGPVFVFWAALLLPRPYSLVVFGIGSLAALPWLFHLVEAYRELSVSVPITVLERRLAPTWKLSQSADAEAEPDTSVTESSEPNSAAPI